MDSWVLKKGSKGVRGSSWSDKYIKLVPIRTAFPDTQPLLTPDVAAAFGATTPTSLQWNKASFSLYTLPKKVRKDFGDPPMATAPALKSVSETVSLHSHQETGSIHESGSQGGLSNKRPSISSPTNTAQEIAETPLPGSKYPGIVLVAEVLIYTNASDLKCTSKLPITKTTMIGDVSMKSMKIPSKSALYDRQISSDNASVYTVKIKTVCPPKKTLKNTFGFKNKAVAEAWRSALCNLVSIDGGVVFSSFDAYQKYISKCDLVSLQGSVNSANIPLTFMDVEGDFIRTNANTTTVTLTSSQNGPVPQRSSMRQTVPTNIPSSLREGISASGENPSLANKASPGTFSNASPPSRVVDRDEDNAFFPTPFSSMDPAKGNVDAPISAVSSEENLNSINTSRRLPDNSETVHQPATAFIDHQNTDPEPQKLTIDRKLTVGMIPAELTKNVFLNPTSTSTSSSTMVKTTPIDRRRQTAPSQRSATAQNNPSLSTDQSYNITNNEVQPESDQLITVFNEGSSVATSTSTRGNSNITSVPTITTSADALNIEKIWRTFSHNQHYRLATDSTDAIDKYNQYILKSSSFNSILLSCIFCCFVLCMIFNVNLYIPLLTCPVIWFGLGYVLTPPFDLPDDTTLKATLLVSGSCEAIFDAINSHERFSHITGTWLSWKQLKSVDRHTDHIQAVMKPMPIVSGIFTKLYVLYFLRYWKRDRNGAYSIIFQGVSSSRANDTSSLYNHPDASNEQHHIHPCDTAKEALDELETVFFEDIDLSKNKKVYKEAVIPAFCITVSPVKKSETTCVVSIMALYSKRNFPINPIFRRFISGFNIMSCILDDIINIKDCISPSMALEETPEIDVSQDFNTSGSLDTFSKDMTTTTGSSFGHNSLYCPTEGSVTTTSTTSTTQSLMNMTAANQQSNASQSTVSTLFGASNPQYVSSRSPAPALSASTSQSAAQERSPNPSPLLTSSGGDDALSNPSEQRLTTRPKVGYNINTKLVTNVHLLPRSTMPRPFWAEPHGSRFNVRGPLYNKDKKKYPSSPSILNTVGVDIFGFEDPDERINILGHPRNIIYQENKAAENRGMAYPFTFALNLILPTRDNLSIVIYMQPEIQDPSILLSRNEDQETSTSDLPAKDSGGSDGEVQFTGMADVPLLLKQFVEGTDSFRNARFKLVPMITEGNFIIKSAVNKPAIIGNKGVRVLYHKGKNWFEVDVDVNSDRTARSLTGMCLPISQKLVVDLGCCIEAQSDAELPERLLGAARFNRADLSKFTYVPKST